MEICDVDRFCNYFMWDQNLERKGIVSESELHIYFFLRNYLCNVFPCRE